MEKTTITIEFIHNPGTCGCMFNEYILECICESDQVLDAKVTNNINEKISKSEVTKWKQ